MTARKRPGAKDISDLKAKLGLKKSSNKPSGGPGGVVPPPGMGGRGAVPPPGMNQHVPAPPGTPGAQPQRQAAQPEVIVVREGEEVDEVGKSKGIGRIAILAGIAILPFVLGTMCGSVSAKNKAYNQGIDAAGKIAKRVNETHKTIAEIGNTLLAARKKGFMPDPDITKKLKAHYQALPDLVDTKDVYSSDLGDNEVAKYTIAYFERAKYIREELADHLKAAIDLDPQVKKMKEANVEKAKAVGRFIGLKITYDKDGNKDIRLGSSAVGKLVQLDGPAKGRATVNTRTNRKEGNWSPTSVFRPGSKDEKASVGEVIIIGDSPLARELYQDKEFKLPVEEYHARLKDLEEEINGTTSEAGVKEKGLRNSGEVLVRELKKKAAADKKLLAF